MPRADDIRNAFPEIQQRPRYSVGWREFLMILFLGSILPYAFFFQAPAPAPRINPPPAAAATAATSAAGAVKPAVAIKPGVPRVAAPAAGAAAVVSPAKAAAARAVAIAPKTSPAKPGEPAVLTIGEERITKAQFEEIIHALPADIQKQIGTPAARRQFAAQYAEMKALAIEGHKKMAQDEKLRRRWQFQLDQTVAKLLMSTVDEPAARKYYDEHKGEFESANGRHILVRFKGSPVPVKPEQKDLTDEEALAKVNDIKKRLAAGEDFAEIARKDSDDTGSGAAGGSLGDFSRGMMVGPFDQAAFTLPIGQISEPVKTQFGYHIIQIQSKKSSTYEEALPVIERKQAAVLSRQTLEDVKKRYPVVLEETYFGKE